MKYITDVTTHNACQQYIERTTGAAAGMGRAFSLWKLKLAPASVQKQKQCDQLYELNINKQVESYVYMELE